MRSKKANETVVISFGLIRKEGWWQVMGCIDNNYHFQVFIVDIIFLSLGDSQ